MVTGQELLPTREFRHTGFYQDVMACSDIYDCLSITLEGNGADNAVLILYRTRTQALFNKQDTAMFTTLVPHLRWVIRMRRLLDEQHFMQGMNTQALDCLAIGIVLLDRSGIIRYVNRSADAILSSGDGLTVRHGRLAAAHSDNELLERMIAGALAKMGSTASSSELCIRRSSGTLPYVLQILPLNPDASEHVFLTPRSSAHGAIITITDPTQSIEPSPRALKDMFNLTPTEAAIAAELAAGNSIREIANARDISERTVRWHVSNVQSKLGVRRLVDLVRLVASSNGPGKRTERKPSPRRIR